MAAKYDELDNKIITLIEQGCNEFSRICFHLKDVEWRTIDRRLQAMRKKGEIRFIHGGLGWRLVR